MTKFDTEEKSVYRLLTIPPWAWFLLGGGVLLLFLFFLWFFFGTIPITLEGRGIILTDRGLYNLQSKINGTVVKQKIKAGDLFHKGDLLMSIYDPQIELKYQETKSRVVLSKNQLKKLKLEIGREERDLKSALKIKMDAIKYTLELLQEEINFGTQELTVRKGLLDEGLISPLKYDEGVLNLSQKKIDFQNKVSDIAQIRSDLSKKYRENEIETKEQQLRKEEENLKILKVSLDQGKVMTPYEGKILEILVNDGDQVKIGDPLVWMERMPSGKEEPVKYMIYGYFQVDTGKKIHPGTTIKMAVPYINKNLYGKITGIVKEVSLFAVSTEQLNSQIHNKALIEFLTNSASAVIQVVIEPDIDPKNPDLFQWSSGLQPPLQVTSGTVGSIEATVEKVRPIFYLIPLPIFKSF